MTIRSGTTLLADAEAMTQHTPADVRGRIIRASILPIEDEETMIARLRAGAEAVERGELDAEDFAGIWSQYLRELLRASSVPAPADVRELAVEVIRLNTALALLKTEENAAHVEAVATNAAWLEELERIAAFATRTPALRLDAALCSEAQGEEDAVRRTWEQAVQRAYGCLDYCGGYRGAELKAFHSGIKTVIRALEAGLDTVDTQTAALDRIGAARRGEGGE